MEMAAVAALVLRMAFVGWPRLTEKVLMGTSGDWELIVTVNVRVMGEPESGGMKASGPGVTM